MYIFVSQAKIAINLVHLIWLLIFTFLPLLLKLVFTWGRLSTVETKDGGNNQNIWQTGAGRWAVLGENETDWSEHVPVCYIARRFNSVLSTKSKSFCWERFSIIVVPIQMKVLSLCFCFWLSRSFECAFLFEMKLVVFMYYCTYHNSFLRSKWGRLKYY